MSVSFETTLVSHETIDSQLIEKALEFEKRHGTTQEIMHQFGETYAERCVFEYGFRRAVIIGDFIQSGNIYVPTSISDKDYENEEYMNLVQATINQYSTMAENYRCESDECTQTSCCKDCMMGACDFDLAGDLREITDDLLDFTKDLNVATRYITNEAERYRTVTEMTKTKLRPIIDKELRNGMEKTYPGISRMLLIISVNRLVNVMRNCSYSSGIVTDPEIVKFGEEMEEIDIVSLMQTINYCFGFGIDFPRFVFEKTEVIFNWFCKINKFGFDQIGEHFSLDYSEKNDLKVLKEKSKVDVFEMKTFIIFLMKPEDDKNENINTGSDIHKNKIVSVRESLIRRNENYFDNFQYGIYLFELTFGNLQTNLYGY